MKTPAVWVSAPVSVKRVYLKTQLAESWRCREEAAESQALSFLSF